MVVFKLEWARQGTYEQTRSLHQKGQLDAGIQSPETFLPPALSPVLSHEPCAS
jgi:hypothetical protein